MRLKTPLKEPAVIKQSEGAVLEFDESIIDTVREPLIALDQDLRIVKVSRSFYEFFKVKPEDTVGQLIYDLGNKQWDIPKLRELLETILPQKTVFDNYEVEHNFATIGKRIMLLNARQIQRRSGREKIILLAIEDITDRRQTEKRLAEKNKESLRASEEKYRLLVENINEIFYILDNQGNIMYISPAVERLTKYKVGDLLGKPFIPIIYPDDLPALLDNIKHLAAGHLEPWEFRVQDKDGNILFMRSSSPTLYKDGQITGFTSLMADITERKRAEKDLKDSEERYRNLFEAAAEGIIVTKGKTKIFKYVNPALCKMLGYNLQELTEMSVDDIHPKDALDHILHEFEALAKGEKTLALDISCLRKDGRVVYADIKAASALIDGEECMIGFFADITERKEANEKLEQSYESLRKTLDDAINTMVKIVELRDPYTAGHQQKVADLAVAIAREMKFGDIQVDQLRVAAVIHDIGKIYVPSDLLSKPGKLTDIEFSLIKTHAQNGYDIVKGMELPGAVAETILQHHERLDGSGYPNGLKAEDTLMKAKILAVADVVEAMASHRPYRPALGIDKALEEITNNKSKLYDPDVVDACLELFTSGKFEFKSV